MLCYLHCYKRFSVLVLCFRSELSGIALPEVPGLAQSKQNLFLLMVFSAQLSFLLTSLSAVSYSMVSIELKPNHLVIPNLISSLALRRHHRMYAVMFQISAYKN